jgi:hypothetical protein
MDSTGSRSNPLVGFYEHGDESSGSVKSGEFHDELNNHSPFKEDAAPWSSLLFRL